MSKIGQELTEIFHLENYNVQKFSRATKIVCDYFKSDHGNMSCESVEARSFLRGNKNEIFVALCSIVPRYDRYNNYLHALT